MTDQASELRKLHEPSKWAMQAAKNYLGSPQYEANGTKESWKRADIACEVEYLKLARIIDVESGTDICHGTFVGELDGVRMLGTIFDGTDAACPGWWRGHDNGWLHHIKVLDDLQTQNVQLLEALKDILVVVNATGIVGKIAQKALLHSKPKKPTEQDINNEDKR